MLHTFRALARPDFRLYFVGFGIATTGTWMRRTAFAWLVYEMSGSEAVLGSVLAVSLLPLLVLSPVAGAVADRVDRRRLLMAGLLGSAAVSAAVALLLWSGRAQIWHLFLLGSLAGAGMAFEIPTRHALVAQLAGEELPNAVALNSAMINLARVFGPASGGVVMGWLGLAPCFALSSLALVCHALLLLPVRLAARQRPPRPSLSESLASGVREASRNLRVKAVLLLLLAAVCFGISFETLLPAIARDVLGLDELEYGLFGSLFGIGAVAGALLLASRRGGGPQRYWMFGGVWAMAAGMLALSYGDRVAWMAPALLLMGVGWAFFLATGNVVVQSSVDDDIRGRVMALWSVGFGAALPAGAFLAGHLAAATSSILTVRLFAVLLGGISILLYRRLPPRAQLT